MQNKSCLLFHFCGELVERNAPFDQLLLQIQQSFKIITIYIKVGVIGKPVVVNIA